MNSECVSAFKNEGISARYAKRAWGEHCHMYHLVKSQKICHTLLKILDLSTSLVRMNPKFHSPAPAQLIKVTQPFERLNTDF